MAKLSDFGNVMAYGDGGSAMGLYHRAGPEGGPPADTGADTSHMLADRSLSARSRYADPMMARNEATFDRSTNNASAAAVNQIGDYYNDQPALPVKYSVPTAAKERFQAKQEIIKAAGAASTPSAPRPAPIGEDEVDYLMAMKDQAELADFDRYVNSLIDPRKPGNLKWLMEIYPKFVERRISQVHTDYEYALRNQMIDSWGINTFDDLHFKYLVDQGELVGASNEGR